MRNKSPIRTLALDLHPRSFGYVVVEGPDRLLDWGVCAYRDRGNSTHELIQRRLHRLFALWIPSVVVVHNPPTTHPRVRVRKARLLKRIVSEARKYRVGVHAIKIESQQNPGKKLTKYENARRVAEHFPVLTRELPPERRAWESEHYGMSIFTAAALAMSQHHSTAASTPERSLRSLCGPEHGPRRQVLQRASSLRHQECPLSRRPKARSRHRSRCR
jgi:hypothetical protein